MKVYTETQNRIITVWVFEELQSGCDFWKIRNGSLVSENVELGQNDPLPPVHAFISGPVHGVKNLLKILIDQPEFLSVKREEETYIQGKFDLAMNTNEKLFGLIELALSK